MHWLITWEDSQLKDTAHRSMAPPKRTARLRTLHGAGKLSRELGKATMATLTIEGSDTHAKTAKSGETAFLSTLLLAGICLATALNLSRVLRKRAKLV